MIWIGHIFQMMIDLEIQNKWRSFILVDTYIHIWHWSENNRSRSTIFDRSFFLVQVYRLYDKRILCYVPRVNGYLTYGPNNIWMEKIKNNQNLTFRGRFGSRSTFSCSASPNNVDFLWIKFKVYLSNNLKVRIWNIMIL